MADIVQGGGFGQPPREPLREAVVIQLLIDEILGRQNVTIYPAAQQPHILTASLKAAVAQAEQQIAQSQTAIPPTPPMWRADP